MKEQCGVSRFVRTGKTASWLPLFHSAIVLDYLAVLERKSLYGNPEARKLSAASGTQETVYIFDLRRARGRIARLAYIRQR